MAGLFWLSDAQWAVIEPFMPKNRPGPERNDDRQVISGILHVLKRGRKRRIRQDKRRYWERWRIEATFNRLKHFRRIATRYDKLARNYASTLALAAVIAFWSWRIAAVARTGPRRPFCPTRNAFTGFQRRSVGE